jgi:serine/threonine protein kinase
MKHCPQCDSGYPDSHTTCPLHGVVLNEILDLKPGMVVHQSYRIVRKLGQGGMGAVYLAKHTLMDEPRALKFLSPQLSRDQAFTGRFLREVRTLRQVRNRNVVDCGDLEAAEDGSLFFSMEYVDGPDLRDFLNGFRPDAPDDCHPDPQKCCHPERSAAQSKDLRLPFGALPVELAIHIARGIAEGLGAAHGKGMVHRDIKPENILMAREGGAWVPKIADFGIVATKESSSVYTRTGGTLLTMAYAAPEQWRGAPAAELDGRTDLYALGGVLFEMLTGQTPFQAENYEGWARQHQTAPPPPPSTRRPELANQQGLDALVLRLLAKDRSDRPKDAAELLGLLDAMQCLPSDAQRKTAVENRISHATKLLQRKVFRQVPRWGRTPLIAVLALAIVITGIAFSLPSSTISKHAGEFDKAHNYIIGGIFRNLACLRDNAEACRVLGIIYRSGNGVARDYSHAAELFNKSCDAGDAEGCGLLGYMYDQGTGVEHDPSRAAALYSQKAALFLKACNAGDASACEDLGFMHENGDEISRDYSRAAAFYLRACEAGKASDCFDLGFMYDQGTEIARDYPRAAGLYSRACDAGIARACSLLGDMYAVGNGVAEDYAKAAATFSKACYAGDSSGCNELASWYMNGWEIGKDAGMAKQLYEKGCFMGDKDSCNYAEELRQKKY